MGDKRNFAALDWVIGEIGETLKEARQALEAYVEDPRDGARIRFCLTHIHQVHGTLQMVEFHGASLFAEEMELLTVALINGEVAQGKEAQEVLMRSLLQLPLYLEQVRTYHEDHPGFVLPLLNDLRAVRKQSLLSESNLFNPDLSALDAPTGPRHSVLNDPAKLQQVLKKLREMYQFAAASVLRGVKVDENLGYVEKVFSRLEAISRGTASYPVWQVAAALAEALLRDDVELSVAVRSLLRQLAGTLRALEEIPMEVLDTAPTEPLLRNLLYYVARAENGGTRVADVKARYKLDKAVVDGPTRSSGGLVAGPDPDAVRAVVRALQEELNTAKHLLDLGLTGQGGLSDIEEMLPVVKRIADTLAVLGIGDMCKRTHEQHQALLAMCQSGQLSDDVLITAAGRLADLEHRLESIAKGAGKKANYLQMDEREVQIDDAKEAVLGQCRAGIEAVKDAIIESMASKWDPAPLPQAVNVLRDVQGGLNIVPLPRPAAILRSCAEFIDRELIPAETAPVAGLQTLAEAIASVDYYLERLMGGHGDDLEPYLDLAGQCLAQVGYTVDAVTPPPPEPVLPVDALIPEEWSEAVAEGNALLASGEALDVETGIPLQPADEQVEDTAELEDAAKAPLAMPSEAEFEQLRQEMQAANAGLAQDDDADSDDDEENPIDDEIIEIFVEEAAEVQETLAQYFPQWREDQEDQEALSTVRRAFHTLKGSGRMVGALEVGEMAWAIENMLNRIVDGSVEPQPMHTQLVANALSLLPSLVRAFEHKQPNPEPERTQRYIEWANALAKGEMPNADDEFDTPVDEEYDAMPAAPAVATDAAELADGSDENENQVLWDIFASEAITHLEEVDAFIREMEDEAPLYTTPSDHLQRALHTLKGSAHMAAVTPIASLIAPLESFIKDLRSYQIRIDDDILQLIRDSADYTLEGLHQIEAREPVELPKLAQFVARVQELQELYVAPLIHTRDQGGPIVGPQPVDPRLLSILMAEAMQLLLDAHVILDRWQAEPEVLPAELSPLIDELRTLSEGASQAKLPVLSQLCDQLAAIHWAALDGVLAADDSFFAAVQPAHDRLLDMVDAVAAAQTIVPVEPELQERLDELGQLAARHTAADKIPSEPSDEQPAAEPTLEFWQYPQGDSAGQDDVAEDGEAPRSVSAEADEASDEPAAEPETSATADSEAYPLHTAELDDQTPMDAGAEQSDSDDLDVAEPVEEDIAAQMPDEALAEGPEADAEDATRWTDAFAAAEDAESSPEDDYADAAMMGAAEAYAPDEDLHESPEYETDDANEQPELEASIAPPGPESEAEFFFAGDMADFEGEDFDQDIIEIFLEEAGELIEEMDGAIHAWESNPASGEFIDTMTRALHTLKGGARLSGLKRLGDLTHNYESFLMALGRTTPDRAFFRDVQRYQDALMNGTRAVRAKLDGTPAPEQVEVTPPPGVAEPQAPASPQVHAPATDDTLGQILPFAPRVEPEHSPVQPPSAMPEMPASPAQPTAQPPARHSPQEMIKVPAELLEELVNLAGETSISRGRLEQQINDLSSSVDEVEATLRRLNEQLRRLDMETEAQVLFRQEQMAAHEGFDPLEMDRYSQLQQLTRSLMESASDLSDLKNTLKDKLRGTETLLLQQQRINSSLQEGLMRSRMVPFSRLVPRLRRIVRQVSGELGKQVNFELDNVEGEMDRSVLERMVAPLEHMLRNAVDHGIESPADRLASHKPETGRILLSLAREGGDILLRLADDGRGINLQRVREKALERGLMAEGAELSDHDVMQFILQAGFSTAENVTQISGRGVGMDVVAAEIKQLGGSMVIDSRSGVGTQFTVRLPFTVSVNRALMVQLGLESYAIPLNTIEGIVRVSPFELEHYYSHPEARFEYAGENYQVRHLGVLLSPDFQPRLDGQVLPLPVILVRSGLHTMALQVDGLMGSREIVVKSLGPQFAAVQGVSGATVMGDGSVVIILDPHALVRREVAFLGAPQAQRMLARREEEPEKEESHKTIMVVDDSVTVRKVTSRFLERAGFDVITAKDGVDALQLLQENMPDLMLLDIEMPRMDGFETAKIIRSSSRLKHLPIIMITSRTGDKHRQHALSIGVNEYLGKPYQEEPLLRMIETLLQQQTQTA